MQHELHLSEILANSITHGVGAALALAGGIYLVVAVGGRSARLVASCAVFAVTLFLLYLCSTLYHSLARTAARQVFRILDHSAIYLLIAGTYTPFALVLLPGPRGWVIFGIEWGLAVAGVVYKSLAVNRFPVASVLIYLIQGWLAVAVVRPLIHTLGLAGLVWLGAGGLAYTLGIVFYAMDRRRFFHAAWHLAVMAGSVAHYCAILFFVVPAGS